MFIENKKMAFSCLRNSLICSYIPLRPLRSFMNAQRCLHFSTSEKLSSDKDTPVKFTSSKGAEVTITETIGIGNTARKYAPKYEKFVILASVAVILIYFCILREENDIDEILKGNLQYSKNQSNVELLNLKIKLIYCQQNNLPTDALKARITELEKSNLIGASFSK